MLERVPVIIRIMAVIVRVTQESILPGKDVRGIDRRHGKSGLSGIPEREHVPGFIAKVSAVFIAEIG
jgi:hypothetical protein